MNVRWMLLLLFGFAITFTPLGDALAVENDSAAAAAEAAAIDAEASAERAEAAADSAGFLAVFAGLTWFAGLSPLFWWPFFVVAELVICGFLCNSVAHASSQDEEDVWWAIGLSVVMLAVLIVSLNLFGVIELHKLSLELVVKIAIGHFVAGVVFIGCKVYLDAHLYHKRRMRRLAERRDVVREESIERQRVEFTPSDKEPVFDPDSDKVEKIFLKEWKNDFERKQLAKKVIAKRHVGRYVFTYLVWEFYLAYRIFFRGLFDLGSAIAEAVQGKLDKQAEEAAAFGLS